MQTTQSSIDHVLVHRVARGIRIAGILAIGAVAVMAGCTVHILENVRYPAVQLPELDPLPLMPTTQPVQKPTPRTDHFGDFMRRIP